MSDSRCPQCHSTDVEIVDTRPLKPPYRYRRRRCRVCDHRYSQSSFTAVTPDGVIITVEASTLRELELAWQRINSLLL